MECGSRAAAFLISDLFFQPRQREACRFDPMPRTFNPPPCSGGKTDRCSGPCFFLCFPNGRVNTSKALTPNFSTRLAQTAMRRALTLARRGLGRVSPNPAVGAVLIKAKQVIGEGWHHGPGKPHAEVEAIRSALAAGHSPAGAHLYVTLEPCSTTGRTPPCTQAIQDHRIRAVTIATTDPNPAHAGKAFDLLRAAGVEVHQGPYEAEARELNAAFNHWIVHRRPLVTVKSAMTLDGKIATQTGESQWITGTAARRKTMLMRRRHDAILVGIGTVLQDDPSLTVRTGPGFQRVDTSTILRRIILDTHARTPPGAKVCMDAAAAHTTIVVGKEAPTQRVAKLQQRVAVWRAPHNRKGISIPWLLRRLGEAEVTNLMVEGGGQINASFLEGGHAHRIAFFYAPKILGGRDSKKAVAGVGMSRPEQFLRLKQVRWSTCGVDRLLTAQISNRG